MRFTGLLTIEIAVNESDPQDMFARCVPQSGGWTMEMRPVNNEGRYRTAAMALRRMADQLEEMEQK